MKKNIRADHVITCQIIIYDILYKHNINTIRSSIYVYSYFLLLIDLARVILKNSSFVQTCKRVCEIRSIKKH